MQILKTISDLRLFLTKNGGQPGRLADTGFLYALAYDDDRVHKQASDVFDELSQYQVPLFANVVSRMEFIDLIFRKQVTLGAIQVFNGLNSSTSHQKLFNTLKNIRDENTAAKNKTPSESYKIGENHLKKLRRFFEDAQAGQWLNFCNQYVGSKLPSEWSMLENDFGLNFVELLQGTLTPLFQTLLKWEDMVKIMGDYGIRGRDAMIINMFESSKFPLVVTSDSDFESYFSDSRRQQPNRSVFLL